MAFAEHLGSNVGRLWIEATLEQRQQIQAAISLTGYPSPGLDLEPRQPA